MDRYAVVRSLRTGRRTRARRRGRHRLRLSPARDFRVDSNATLRPRVARSSGEELELLLRSPAGMGGTPRSAPSTVSRLLLATWIWVPGWLVFNTGRPKKWVGLLFGGVMRKPRPATYNPAQALHLIASDRTGSPLSCPSCSGNIERSPTLTPPAPHSHVTLKCTACGRVARYIAGAA